MKNKIFFKINKVVLLLLIVILIDGSVNFFDSSDICNPNLIFCRVGIMGDVGATTPGAAATATAAPASNPIPDSLKKLLQSRATPPRGTSANPSQPTLQLFSMGVNGVTELVILPIDTPKGSFTEGSTSITLSAVTDQPSPSQLQQLNRLQNTEIITGVTVADDKTTIVSATGTRTMDKDGRVLTNTNSDGTVILSTEYGKLTPNKNSRSIDDAFIATQRVTYTCQFGQGYSYGVDVCAYTDKNGGVISLGAKGTDNQQYFYQDGKWYQLDATNPVNADGKLNTATPANLDNLDPATKDTVQSSSGKSSVINFWNQFQNIFGHTGLRGLSSLFYNETYLKNWRESVDQFFAKNYLGSEYWLSEICSSKIESQPQAGLVYITTPSGGLEIGAHVEGTRTPMLSFNETTKLEQGSYLYKISFVVKNMVRVNETIKFDVKLYGQRTMNMYNDTLKVEQSQTMSKTGSSMIVKESPYYYDKICIKFKKEYKIAGDSVTEVCNRISDVPGSPTRYDFPEGAVTTTATTDVSMSDF